MNLLIDGSSLLWRTYHANKKQNRANVPENIHLFLKSLKSYATMYNSQDVYIAWDKKLLQQKNFRQSNDDVEYKEHRDKDMAARVYESQQKIHKITQTLGCKNFYPWVMEADDIISWLSVNLEGSNIIVTTDKDMLQLINNRTCVYHPRKKEVIDHKNFETIMEMPIEHFLPYKAILGDTSDNITGIEGYGLVRSKKLAKQWVEDKDSIDKEMVPIIERNIKFMDLSIGYTVSGPKEVEAYQMQLDRYTDLTVDMSQFEALCKEYNFNSILKDIDKWKTAFETPHLLAVLNNLAL